MLKSSWLPAALCLALAACVPDDPVRPAPPAAKAGNPNLRIAVVGAGPSGLTAALALKDRGYKHVTVFEKEGRVGGKVNSIRILSSNAELGAVFASPDYELVLGLADRYKVPYASYSGKRFIMDEKGRQLTFEEFLLSRHTREEIARSIAAYAAALKAFDPNRVDGFANVHPDLHLTFDVFAAKHGFAPVAELAKSLMVGFGYGYYETVPAQYFMKLMPWLVKVGPNGLESPPYYTFSTGFQSVWEAVAKDLDVRLHSKVTRIDRGRPGRRARVVVNVFHPGQFDVVIISAPLNAVKYFLVQTPEEKELFAKVETSRYFVTLFSALGLAGGGTVFLHDHARPAKINHSSVWGHPGGALPFFVAYQLADKRISSSQVTTVLAEDVWGLGGALFTGALVKKEWDYFPRVSTAALDQGFNEKVESLQGRDGIYYVGGSLSFETVEHSARYARALVGKHFPPVP